MAKLIIEDTDCGGAQIELCGKRRAMVMELQYKEMREHKRRPTLAHIVEKILDREADNYFKGK